MTSLRQIFGLKMAVLTDLFRDFETLKKIIFFFSFLFPHSCRWGTWSFLFVVILVRFPFKLNDQMSISTCWFVSDDNSIKVPPGCFLASKVRLFILISLRCYILFQRRDSLHIWQFPSKFLSLMSTFRNDLRCCLPFSSTQDLHAHPLGSFDLPLTAVYSVFVLLTLS